MPVHTGKLSDFKDEILSKIDKSGVPQLATL